MNIQPALTRGAVDGGVHVELVGGAFAREAAQAAQRDLDVARAELAVAVEVAKLDLLPPHDPVAVHGSILAARAGTADYDGWESGLVDLSRDRVLGI